MSSIKTIFLDFDGVITPRTPQIFAELTYRIINAHTFLSEQTIINYFQSIINFSPWEGISFFFNELGLQHLIPEIEVAYKKLIINNLKFEAMIDKDFFLLVEYLNNNGIKWKIVSLGATEHLTKIDVIQPKNIYNLNAKSKANPQTFKNMIESLGDVPEECMIIDDGILSIRAAKLNGFHTVFMQTNFYGTEEDYQLYKKFVDHRVFNLKELIEYISLHI